jgi:hypothetical protein
MRIQVFSFEIVSSSADLTRFTLEVEPTESWTRREDLLDNRFTLLERMSLREFRDFIGLDSFYYQMHELGYTLE